MGKRKGPTPPLETGPEALLYCAVVRVRMGGARPLTYDRASSVTDFGVSYPLTLLITVQFYTVPENKLELKV